MTEHGQWLLAVFFLSCALAGIAYALSWFAIQFTRWLRCKVIEWRLGREYTQQATILSAKDGTWDTRYRRDFASTRSEEVRNDLASKRVSRVPR